MAEVNITYKGASIATMDDSGSKTLQTTGKYCEGDITVAYERPSGGGTSMVTIAMRCMLVNADNVYLPPLGSYETDYSTGTVIYYITVPANSMFAAILSISGLAVRNPVNITSQSITVGTRPIQQQIFFIGVTDQDGSFDIDM